MANKNVKVIYKKIEPEFLNKYGYINLNHREVNTKSDLVEIASIFRNPMYETFRIIYMKNKSIVGYESISSRGTRTVEIFPKSKSGRNTNEKCFYKISDRMRRLNANGYYMVHNHPSGHAKASRDDLKVTEAFAENLAGFLGHLIVNTESYAWIDVDKYGIAKADNFQEVKKLKKDRYYKMLNKKSIYDVKIESREDLVALMHHIKNSKDYSSLIFCDARGKIRMIQDMPNRFLNMKDEQLEGYLANQKLLNGATRVFFATTDNEVYKKAIKFWQKEVFLDAICYKEEDSRIYTYEKVRVETVDNIENINRIRQFEEMEEKIEELRETNKVLAVTEDNETYKRPDVLKVLLKRVGKEPEVVEIKNNLETKQELVGGLIEVVQYDDVIIICNEEGKVLGLPPNLIFELDYIAGDCFIVGDDYEHGDFKSLTDDEIRRYKKDLSDRGFKYKSEDDFIPSKEKERGERMRGKA